MNQRSISEQITSILPSLCCALLIIISASPAPFSWLPAYPHVLLIGVFFFTLYAPQSLPFWAIFLLGLLVDATASAPLGLHALLALAACLLVKRTSRVLGRQAFRVLWLAFALLACVYFSALHVVSDWLAADSHGSWQNQLPWLGSTVLFYPLLHALFSKLLHPTHRA